MAIIQHLARRWHRGNRPPMMRRPSDGGAKPWSGTTKRGGIVVRRDRRGKAIS